MGFIDRFDLPKLLAKDDTIQDIRKAAQEAKFLHGDLNTLGERITTGLFLSKEPQRSYQFELEVLETSGDDSGGNIFTDFVDGIRDLKYFVKTVDFPIMSKELIEYNFMDTKVSYVGKDSSPHTFSITFWDDEALTITDYMKKWYDLSGQSKYQEGVDKKTYSKDMKIKLLDVTGFITTGEFTFYNCTPIELGGLNLSYEDSNALEFSITFYYDYYELSGMK